jgi:hypothetical protein
MLIASLFLHKRKTKKVEFFFGDYQPSQELSHNSGRKSGETTNGLK